MLASTQNNITQYISQCGLNTGETIFITLLPMQIKNVDILSSAQDASLELESQIIFKRLGARKPKGFKQDIQNRLRSRIPEGGVP